MAHSQTIDDPEQALHEINRQRSVKTAVAGFLILGALAAVGAGVAYAYSDAPDARPGLQSR
jgi:hypothetical protein